MIPPPPLAARPEHPALHQLPSFRHLEVRGDVPERAVEHPTLPPALCPRHRQLGPLYPGSVLACEGGGCQDPDVGVYVHVVLLGVHLEVLEAGGYLVLVVNDVYLVVDDAAGVGDELSADHELVVRVVAERVGQAPVPAGEADPTLDRLKQTPLLPVGDLPHTPDLYDQVEG